MDDLILKKPDFLPSLTQAFARAANPAAPAYEPHLWNDAGEQDVQHFESQFPLLYDAIKAKGLRTSFDQISDQFMAPDDVLADRLRLKPDYIAGARAAHKAIAATTRYSTNCFAYAINRRFGHNPGLKPQPGLLSRTWYYTATPPSRETILNRLQSDGLILRQADEAMPDNHYALLLYIQHDNGQDEDYHFVRQDRDGGWSHKFGHEPVTDLDANGDRIDNPFKADFGPYQYTDMLFCPAGGL